MAQGIGGARVMIMAGNIPDGQVERDSKNMMSLLYEGLQQAEIDNVQSTIAKLRTDVAVAQTSAKHSRSPDPDPSRAASIFQ